MTAPSVLVPPYDPYPGTSFYEHELPGLIQNIKNDCGWKAGDLKTIVVRNEPDRKIILTALQPYTEIESHQTGECILFQVMEGALKISVRKESTILTGDQKFTLYDHIKYKLLSLSETIFLMILLPGKQ
jgi:hypothetical protein